MSSVEKIDHHRTGTIHALAEKQPDIGTVTMCGKTLPHTPDTSDIDDEVEVDCDTCIKSMRSRGS